MTASYAIGRALVVVPTYNERETLEPVVRRALDADERVHVLVVDDGSPDGTGEVAAGLAGALARVWVHDRPGKQGLASAYRHGLAWGVSQGFDAVGEMDGDGSHDPGDLPRLLDALGQGADVAIGSRYIPGGRADGWAARRRLLSRAGNGYVRLLTGCPVRDATSGFRVYRREALRSVPPAQARADGYGFQVEMALRCWQAGLEVRELPITFRERLAGDSKLGAGSVVEALWRGVLWGAAARTGRWRA